MFGEAWEKFKMLITPESHAESIVNEIYSIENKGLLGTSGYPPEPKLYPAVARLPSTVAAPYIGTAKAVSAVSNNIKSFVGDVKSGTQKTMIYLFVALLALAAVYGFFGRK